MNLNNLISTLNLRGEAKKELDQVLALPEVTAILNREEQSALAERSVLVKQLAGLPKKHERLQKQAEENAVEAATRLHQAEENLRLARHDHMLAIGAAQGAVHAESRERFDLENQLFQGRDSRLVEYDTWLSTTEGKVRNAFSAWPELGARHWFAGTREKSIGSNLSEIEKAMAVLAEARQDIRTMSFEAVSKQEVSERLASWTEKLEKPLNPFGITPPIINEQGEIELVSPVKLAEVLKAVRHPKDLAA